MVSYLAKAEEFLSAASSELTEHRSIAAASLAIHAAINAADAVTGARAGRRAAAQHHDGILELLRQAGADGEALAKELARVLPLKTRAEYEPDAVPLRVASKAVERAGRCVNIARRVCAGL